MDTHGTPFLNHNAGVGGSSPPVATIYINRLQVLQTAFLFSLRPIAGNLREFSILSNVTVGVELPDQLTFSTAQSNSPTSAAE
ncbi:MAG: hypothetical protein QNK15_05365 [Cycloclasticus sp.]|nr:hypothetical protein [Cycloclasticus sp.]